LRRAIKSLTEKNVANATRFLSNLKACKLPVTEECFQEILDEKIPNAAEMFYIFLAEVKEVMRTIPSEAIPSSWIIIRFKINLVPAGIISKLRISNIMKFARKLQYNGGRLYLLVELKQTKRNLLQIIFI
jgi:hypothetical protein